MNESCKTDKITDCVKYHIDESDLILETTITKSRKYLDKDGKYRIDVTYQIDKILKGYISKKNIALSYLEDDVLANYNSNSSDLQEKNRKLYAPKIGTVGISFFQLDKLGKISGRFTPFAWKFSNSEKINDQPILILRNGQKTIEFGEREVYDFVESYTRKGYLNKIKKNNCKTE